MTEIKLQGFAPKVLAHGHHRGNRVAVVVLDLLCAQKMARFLQFRS
jgi:hypothetical protein